MSDSPAKAPIRDSIGLPFTLFRARDALPYDEAGVMSSHPPTEAQIAGGARLMAAGALGGSSVHLAFSRPGLSITHVWFKSFYPLPRHSHDADCAYYIIAGSLKIGSEELGPGDGFFVGKDVPYTYTAGENGVELLEIRTSNAFDIRVLVGDGPWWDKAEARLDERRDAWAEETAPPSGMAYP
jgi:hypothetical protein